MKREGGEDAIFTGYFATTTNIVIFINYKSFYI